MRKFYVLAVLLVSVNFLANSQSFTATYDFANVTTTSGTTDPTPVPVVSGLSFGSFTATGTPVNPNATGRFSFTDWSLGATNGSDVFTGGIVTSEYYQVTITPNANVTLDVNSITFTIQRSGTGVRQYSVRGSVDAFGSNLPASISPANANLSVVPTNIFQITDPTTSAQNGSTITLDATYDNLTSAVTFRFYGYNAEATGGTFSIDNVVINGTATYTGPITNFYSKSSGNLTTLGTWGTNTDGTGTAPLNFTTDGSVFNVVNRASVTLDANWTVSGSSSKVVTGDGVSATELIVPNSAVLTGFVDVTNLATLRLENSTLPTLGALATGSTVNYAQTATPYTVPTNSVVYHHLRITNGTKTFASGTITVNGNLVVDAVSGFNGGASPFTTVNIAGDFSLSNGAAFDPIVSGEGNRMTVNCIGSVTQSFSGGDLYFFRLQTPASPLTTLDIALGSSLILGNPSGGGINLQQSTHTLSLNGNDLTMYGAAIFSASHVGTISGNVGSDFTINKTAGFASIGSTAFTAGFQQLNNLSYHCAGLGTNDLTLLSNLSVSGNLSMTAGRIQIGNNNLTVSGSATGGSTSYVRTNGTGSLVMAGVSNLRSAPIGNSTYNPLTVNNPSGYDWSLRVEDVLVVDDPAFASNTAKAVQREWHITPSVNPPATGADITFQWDDSDPAQVGASYSNSENVQVWHEVAFGNPYGNDWLAVGVAQTATGTPPGVRTANITGWTWFSPFAISNISGPLPLKLVRFDVVKTGSLSANVNWQLASPALSGSNFLVEKSSDGIHFYGLAEASGDNMSRVYNVNDTRLGKGINYYRLRMKDVDGKISYSKVVALLNDEVSLYITGIAPNPVMSNASMTVVSAKSELISFEVFNGAGVLLKRWNTSVVKGTNIVDLSVDNLPAGIYNLVATGDESRSVMRFVKQ